MRSRLFPSTGRCIRTRSRRPTAPGYAGKERHDGKAYDVMRVDDYGLMFDDTGHVLGKLISGFGNRITPPVVMIYSYDVTPSDARVRSDAADSAARRIPGENLSACVRRRERQFHPHRLSRIFNENHRAAVIVAGVLTLSAKFATVSGFAILPSTFWRSRRSRIEYRVTVRYRGRAPALTAYARAPPTSQHAAGGVMPSAVANCFIGVPVMTARMRSRVSSGRWVSSARQRPRRQRLFRGVLGVAPVFIVVSSFSSFTS